MVSETAITVFAPLMVILALEISNKTHNISQLKNIADEKRPEIYFLRFIPLPNLGRFVFIHFAGMVLLSMMAFSTWHFSSGILRAGLITVAVVVMFSFPLLEVQSYDRLLLDGEIPRSGLYHSGYVAAILILSIFGEMILTYIDNWGSNLAELIASQFFLWTVFVFLPAVGSIHFTRLLHSEIEELSG